MFDDINLHLKKTGDTLINADDGPNVRFIAYKSGPPGSDDYSTSWSIPRERVPYSIIIIELRNPVRGQHLRDAFASARGRQALLQSLQAGFRLSSLQYPNRFDREDPL